MTELGFPVKDLSILNNPTSKNLMSDLVIMVENSPESNVLYVDMVFTLFVYDYMNSV